MPRILVPYHLDEHLPDLDIPLATDTTIRAELPTGDPWHRMAALYSEVSTAVSEAASAGALPTVLSGDCTTSLGIVAGLQRAGVDPAIVWFDGHGDVQTVETTESGYLGGMPLRILTGYRPGLIGERLGLRPVDEGRVVLVDARDLDPPEVDYLAGAAIRRHTVEDLTADTVPDGPLYVHVDFDVVDPGDLPGLLFPAANGPGLDTVADALQRVVGTGRVAAIGLACTWSAEDGAAERVRPYLTPILG